MLKVGEVGKKLDDGKAPVVQGCLHYFPQALEAVAFVSQYGAEKYDVDYSEGNWQQVEDGIPRYTDALGRHVLMEGLETYDQESELLHAAHAAWNALARLEMLIEFYPVKRQTALLEWEAEGDDELPPWHDDDETGVMFPEPLTEAELEAASRAQMGIAEATRLSHQAIRELERQHSIGE